MSYVLKDLPHHIVNTLLPLNEDWAEGLRFYCQTSNPLDPNLDFMARMWSYALVKGTLTGTQRESASLYLHTRHSELFTEYGIHPKFFPEWSSRS